MKVLSTDNLKRQILVEADKSEMKRVIDENVQGIPEGEILGRGNDLEAVTKMPGWNYIEAFMLQHLNVTGMFFGDKEDPVQKGVGKGYILLMQFIQLSIAKRDEIIEKEKTKENEPKDSDS